MNHNAHPIETLFKQAEDYSKTIIELFKLHAIDKSADVVSLLAARLVIFIAFIIFVVITSIGFALWLGIVLGQAYYGMLIVGACYGIAALVLYAYRCRFIKKSVRSAIVDNMMEHDAYANRQKDDALSRAIDVLENKKDLELKSLKEQMTTVQEHFKPINLIKSTFHNANNPEVKNDIVNNAIGLTTGYLSKKILMGTTHNPIKKLVGTFLEFAIAKVVAKNSDVIKTTGGNIFQRLFKRKKPQVQL